ncbi:MAG: hypothetical protein JSV18_02765 [Candidatus Bathyarchaeota archaeon]|nr:MAG: hypothetical protein JSV18_02765 [Candidatus Bathyarchaeota archaeon]
MSAGKQCFPKCRDFKCIKRSLRLRGKQAWCEWTNENCSPRSCTYASCFRRQLLEDGVCGKTIKRKTRDDHEPDDFLLDEIRARGKLMRKTGERSIF